MQANNLTRLEALIQGVPLRDQAWFFDARMLDSEENLRGNSPRPNRLKIGHCCGRRRVIVQAGTLVTKSEQGLERLSARDRVQLLQCPIPQMSAGIEKIPPRVERLDLNEAGGLKVGDTVSRGPLTDSNSQALLALDVGGLAYTPPTKESRSRSIRTNREHSNESQTVPEL